VGCILIMGTHTRADKFDLWLDPTGQWCKYVLRVVHHSSTDHDERPKVSEQLTPYPRAFAAATVSDTYKWKTDSDRFAWIQESRPDIWAGHMVQVIEMSESGVRASAQSDCPDTGMGSFVSSHGKV
jgi:hypothetical protein